MNLNFETDGLNFNNKGKPDEIATPQNICDDMSNLFNYKDCNRKIWADIYCKTGNTLESLKKHGVNKENIIAICDNKQSQMLVCRKLYGKILPEIEVEITVKSLEAYKITRRGQVYWVSDGQSNWQGIVKNNYQNAYNIVKFVILKEMEKTMSLEFTQQDDFQINNIIMNPPYNNDMYLDFVTLAKNIATGSTVAITPAKWQAKGGDKNEAFRKDIVPYMSKIVYYPDTRDVFDISELDGISYYIIGTKIVEEKNIVNKCEHQKLFENSCIRVLTEDCTLNNIGQKLIDKLKIGKTYTLMQYNKKDRYEVWLNNKVSPARNRHGVISAFSDEGSWLCLGLTRIIDTEEKSEEAVKYRGGQDKIVDSKLVFHSMSLDECKYFESWVHTKFVRFLISINIAGLTGVAGNQYWWKFVPDPVNFDHIFTDAELYQKYNLTPDEIAIIESVIKERK